MVGLAAAALLLQAVTLGGRVQSGVTIQPDTVTVAQVFTIAVRVRAPLGATIEFPQTPDSGVVQAVDPVEVRLAADTTATDQTGLYRVAAWDVGELPVRFPDVLVRERAGSRRIAIANVTVAVRSVLPADTTLHVPKPARALFVFGPPWWVWALLALAVAAVLLLLWWLWRRRRRRAALPEDPFVVAERAFGRVEAMGLVAAGERGLHVALMTETLRDFLAAVEPRALASLTTSELLAALRGSPRIPVQRLAALLTEVDLVKFARRPVTVERAQSLGREARAIAAAVQATRTAPAREQAA